MPRMEYWRSFYFLDKEDARHIVEVSVQSDKDDQKLKEGALPLPNIAVDSRFLMVLIDGYLSSSMVDPALKEGLISLYEQLLACSNVPKENRPTAVACVKHNLETGNKIRKAIMESAGFDENEKKISEFGN